MDNHEIDALNAQQQSGTVHPYTCGNNSEHNPLYAGWIGWKCPDCTYFQPYNGNEVF